MKVLHIITIITIVLGMGVRVKAQPPDILWTRTYGGDSNDAGFFVQQTEDGGFIIVGWTESFGAGNKDVYLIKTDVNGHTVWTTTYGGGGDELAINVQQNSDGGYIIVGITDSFGAGDEDFYLVKVDSLGNEEWYNTFGGTAFDGYAYVQQAFDGGTQ